MITPAKRFLFTCPAPDHNEKGMKGDSDDGSPEHWADKGVDDPHAPDDQ